MWTVKYENIPKFEFKLLSVDTLDDLPSSLNDFGKDGWQAVSVIHSDDWIDGFHVLMQREVSSDRDTRN